MLYYILNNFYKVYTLLFLLHRYELQVLLNMSLHNTSQGIDILMLVKVDKQGHRKYPILSEEQIRRGGLICEGLVSSKDGFVEGY